jgi:hypothetical protein
MLHSPAKLAAAFRRQAGNCAELGSPLLARAMVRVAEDIEASGPLGAFLADWRGDLEGGILPLRLFGGFHYLALAGQAPYLAAQFPSLGGTPDSGLWPALLRTLDEHPETLRESIAHPPQTNEVGRSAIFLGGFLEIAARYGLPLAVYEVGASAGLNLCWDRFAYRLGEHRWAGDQAALPVAASWRGGAPRIDVQPRITGRHGCDLRPIDLSEPAAIQRLEGYVWPDQKDRLTTLRSALAIAREMNIRVDTADALDWIEARLAERPRGQTTVVYHSVVLLYLEAAARRRFAAVMRTAGAAATAKDPLAWLAYEPEGTEGSFALHLTCWPGGERRRLALAQPHGRWVEWLV